MSSIIIIFLLSIFSCNLDQAIDPPETLIFNCLSEDKTQITVNWSYKEGDKNNLVYVDVYLDSKLITSVSEQIETKQIIIDGLKRDTWYDLKIYTNDMKNNAVKAAVKTLYRDIDGITFDSVDCNSCKVSWYYREISNNDTVTIEISIYNADIDDYVHLRNNYYIAKKRTAVIENLEPNTGYKITVSLIGGEHHHSWIFKTWRTG